MNAAPAAPVAGPCYRGDAMSVARPLALVVVSLSLVGIGLFEIARDDADPTRAAPTWSATPASAQRSELAVQPSGAAAAATGVERAETPDSRRALKAASSSGFVVQVVDADGVPVSGVPVALRVRVPRGVRDVVRSTTAGPAGLASCEEAVVRELARRAPVLAALAFPLEPPVEKNIDLDAERLVVLELPPTGSLEVCIVGGYGPFEALVNGADPGEADPTAFRDPSSLGLSAPAQDRTVRFDHVGLGLVLDVLATGPDGQRARERVDGPLLAREVVSVQLHMPALPAPRPSWPAIRGRLLEPTGRPAARVSCRAWTTLRLDRRREPVAASISISTDASGVFRVWLHHEHAFHPAQPGSIQLTVIHETSEARVEAAIDPALGPIDLGDLVLEPMPVLVAGEVVDERGFAVVGARVRLEGRFTVGQPMMMARTDDAGAFRIGGWPLDASYGLVVEANGFGVKRIDVASGATDVRVELRRAGSIAGSLLLDPGIALDDVRMDVVRDGWTWTPRMLAMDGGFHSWDVEPGYVDVAFVLRYDVEPLATLASVLVEPGGDTSDPRLENLDLRRGARLVRILVLDARGCRIARPTVTVDVGGKPIRTHANPARLAATRALDVTVEVEGFASVRLTSVTSDRTVVMR